MYEYLIKCALCVGTPADRESTEAASLKFNLSAYWTRGLHSNRICLSLSLTVIRSPTAHWPSVITLLNAHKRTVGCKLQPLLCGQKLIYDRGECTE